MTSHSCDISKKDIPAGEENFGRKAVLVPVSGTELRMQIQFIDPAGRCNVVDVSREGLLTALSQASAHFSGKAAK